MGKNKDKKKNGEPEEESLNQEKEKDRAETEETAEETADADKTAEAEEAEAKEGSGEAPAGDEGSSEEKEDPRDRKIAELNEKVLRQMAEFDNFRKRTEKEKSETFANGEKTVIEAILPVIDNFERALEMASEEKKEDPFMEGMDKVYRQLMDEMDKLGVKPITALGETFDPNLHNAVMQEETEEYESGKVCKELQKGYMLNDSVVRHSMVSVAQ